MNDIPADARVRVVCTPSGNRAGSGPEAAPSSSGQGLERRARHVMVLVLVFGILYRLCHNGQWLPESSDDSLYLTIARNLAQGHGFVWGGIPVIRIPPGFPLFLSAVMRISPRFIVLNLALVLLMLGALVMWYLFLLRYTTGRRALVVMLAVGILFEWHRFAYTHYTEALSYFLLASALLTAARINENKGLAWRMPLLAALSSSLVFVHWRGLFPIFLVAGALLRGEGRPRMNRRWVGALAVAAVSCLTFLAIQHGVSSRLEVARDKTSEGIQRDRATASLKGRTSLVNRHLGLGLGKRAAAIIKVRGGIGIACLLWPPAVAAKRWPSLGRAFNVLGWALFLLLVARLPQAARQRRWIWFATVAFMAALILLSWSIPRYLAPIAPLLLLGLWESAGRCAQLRIPFFFRRTVCACSVAGVAALFLCNLGILGYQVWIVHSPDFLKRYLGGEYLDVLRISKYLEKSDVSAGPIAVLTPYRDVGRRMGSDWGEKVFAFLSPNEFITAPTKLGGVDAPDFMEWARHHGVRFVVTRPETLSTRFWHFREPLFTGGTGEAKPPFYVLFKVEHGGIVPVDLPAAVQGIHRVPGL
jgi:hypothetical protein